MVANRLVSTEAMVQPSRTFCTLLDRFTEELIEQHQHDLKDVLVATQEEKNILIRQLRELRQCKGSCSCPCSTDRKSSQLWQDEELPEAPRRELEAVPVHSAMDEIDEDEEGSQNSDNAGMSNEDLDIVEDVEDWDADLPDLPPARGSTGGASGSFSAAASEPSPPPKHGSVKAPPEDDPSRLFVERNVFNETGSTKTGSSSVENGTENDVVPCDPQDTDDGQSAKSDDAKSTKSGDNKEDAPKDHISEMQAKLQAFAAGGAGQLDPAKPRLTGAKSLGNLAPSLTMPVPASTAGSRQASPRGSHRPSWGGIEMKPFSPTDEIEVPSAADAEAPAISGIKKRSSTTGNLDIHHHKKEHRKKSRDASALSELPELPMGDRKSLELDGTGRRSFDFDHKRGSADRGGGLQAHAGRMSLDVTSMRHNELILHPALQLVAPTDPMSNSRRVTWCGEDSAAQMPPHMMAHAPLHVPPPPPVAVVEEEEQEEEVIEMLPIWKMRRKSTTNMSSARQPRGHRNSLQLLMKSDTGTLRRSDKATLDNMDPDAGPGSSASSFRCLMLSRMVSRPSSAKRLLWDMIGVFLIAYDLFWIPMQAFDPAPTTFTTFMSWLSTVFWTLDIAASFLVGFHREGVLEMRLSRIARHYMKTWLPFDIIVMTVDWSLSVVDIVSENALKNSSVGGVGYMRLGKAIRFLRLLRLLRLLKAHGVVSELIDRIQSESHLIIVGIVKLLVFIMMINHLIACAWYGIGSAAPDGDRNWPFVNALPDRTLAYKYLTSLHWSLTQFTPASMEVTPENELERIFTVTVILSAMIVFSSFVSAITNAMTQLRNLNSERNEQFSSLRRYLGENKCSTALMGRIWTCVQTAMGRTKRRCHESDVKVLQLLPWSLKAELLEEVYSPILGAHPFFCQFSHNFQMQMRKIFQNAVEEISLPIGQELFSSGEAANNMYFVLAGVMVYTKDNKSSCEPPCFVSAGQWVSEAALWIKWKHNGQLIGTTPCELIALKASKVQEVLSHLNYDEDQVKRYVKIFVRYFKKNPDSLTDVWAETDLLNDMAIKAFMGEEDEDEVGIGAGTNGNAMDAQGMKNQQQGMFGFMAQRRQSVNPGMMGGGGPAGGNTRQNASRRQSIFAGGISAMFGGNKGATGTQPGLEEGTDSSSSESDSECSSEEEQSEEEDDAGTIEEEEEDEFETEDGEQKVEKRGSRDSKESTDTRQTVNKSGSQKFEQQSSLKLPEQQGSRRPSATGLPAPTGRRPSVSGLMNLPRRMSLGGNSNANNSRRPSVNGRRPSMTSTDMSKLPLAVLEAMNPKEPPKETSTDNRRPSKNALRRPSLGGGSKRPSVGGGSRRQSLSSHAQQEDKKTADAAEKAKSPKSTNLRPSLQSPAEDVKTIPLERGKSPVPTQKDMDRSKSPAFGETKSLTVPGTDEDGAAKDFCGFHSEISTCSKRSKRSTKDDKVRNQLSIKSNDSACLGEIGDHSESLGPKIKKKKKVSLSDEDSEASLDSTDIDKFLDHCKHKKRSSEEPLQEEEHQSLPLKLLDKVLRTSDGGSLQTSSPFGRQISANGPAVDKRASSNSAAAADRASVGSSKSRSSKGVAACGSTGTAPAGTRQSQDAQAVGSVRTPFRKLFLGASKSEDSGEEDGFKPTGSGRSVSSWLPWGKTKSDKGNRKEAAKAIFPQ